MNKTFITFVFCLLALSRLAHASGNHTHEGEDHHEPGHAAEVRTDIAPGMAKANGLSVATAGPGTVARTIRVYGRLAVPPANQARIQARYPGVVTAVSAEVGDKVEKGDLLATVEANDSLRSYRIHAPFDGLVRSRSVSVGEIAAEQPLFTLINDSILWAELKVFPRHRAGLVEGQRVWLDTAAGHREGRIDSVVPGPSGEPFTVARVALANQAKQLASGDLVTADIVVEQAEAALVVRREAIQEFRGEQVVFVRTGDAYEPRPVRLDRSDGKYVEVLEGLAPGDEYVVENAYLLKADLEKAGAEHAH